MKQESVATVSTAPDDNMQSPGVPKPSMSRDGGRIYKNNFKMYRKPSQKRMVVTEAKLVVKSQGMHNAPS